MTVFFLQLQFLYMPVTNNLTDRDNMKQSVKIFDLCHAKNFHIISQSLASYKTKNYLSCELWAVSSLSTF